MTQRDYSVALCEAQHAQAAAEGRERNTLRELHLLRAALDALQAERRYLDEAAAAGRRVSASALLAPGGVDGGGLGDGANGQAITAPTPYAEQLAQGRSSGSGSGGSGGWRLAQRV